MREIKATKNEWGYNWPDYTELVESMEYEVLQEEEIGSYSGDYFFILRRPDGVLGLLTFGYGSCSGCDTLQSIIGYTDSEEEAVRIAKELTELRNDLAESIFWGTAQEIIDRLNSDFITWWSDNEDAQEKLISFLRERTE